MFSANRYNVLVNRLHKKYPQESKDNKNAVEEEKEIRHRISILKNKVSTAPVAGDSTSIEDTAFQPKTKSKL